MAPPRPTPRRSGPPPRPTPGPPSASQRFLRVAEEEFGRVKREELTAAQRRSLKGISFGTAPAIGQVGGREVAGRTFFRQGSRVTRAVQRGLQAVGRIPGEGIKISEKTTELPAAIRHETAHALLFKAKVPVKQQHAVLRRSKASSKAPIDFGLLPQATRVEQHAPGRSRDQAAKQLRQRLAIRARRLRDQKMSLLPK
jgi:hypothetical protein